MKELVYAIKFMLKVVAMAYVVLVVAGAAGALVGLLLGSV